MKRKFSSIVAGIAFLTAFAAVGFSAMTRPEVTHSGYVANDLPLPQPPHFLV